MSDAINSIYNSITMPKSDYDALCAEIDRLREALRLLLVIADDNHPEYPGKHGIDVVLKQAYAVLAKEAGEWK